MEKFWGTPKHHAAIERHDTEHTTLALAELSLRPESVLDKKVLDIGSGEGELARWVKRAGGEVTALDLRMPERVIERLKMTGVTPVIGDATKLSFPDNSFDLIVSNNAIPNTVGDFPVWATATEADIAKAHEQRTAAIREAVRVLSPGGEIRLAPITRNERGWPMPGRNESIEQILQELKTNPELEVIEELIKKDDEANGNVSDIWRIIIKKKVAAATN